jgi:16S rRNA (cytosine967-C5)-methyltransferase
MAGRSLDDALAATPAADRPALQALAFMALRGWGAARGTLARLASRPPPAALADLLATALALQAPRDEPPPYATHTLVDEAVSAARRVGGTSAGAFANAVLRRALREQASLADALRHDVTARTNLPDWWWQRLLGDWGPATASAIAEAGLHRPPMVLRAQRRRADAATVVARLAEAGVPARAVGAAAVYLPDPRPVQRLPGFAEGWWSVQDLAAQEAAPRLLGATAHRPAVAPGARVLDACAAPGGKTAHLLELQDLQLTALDRDPARTARVGETLARLGLQATVACADAADLAAWWDGRPFDAILLDAPCTASGVVRRHPDIPWLRRESDIAALTLQQDRLLQALWPVLVRGGRLLYATCSVFRDEGSRRIDSFLQRFPDARPLPGAPPPEHRLPVHDNDPASTVTGDGFFYALIEKT